MRTNNSRKESYIDIYRSYQAGGVADLGKHSSDCMLWVTSFGGLDGTYH